jgi:hypothetical protein
MIRYRVPYAELVALVNERAPQWIGDARTRTAYLKGVGAFEEGPPEWSVVKPLFMHLQGENKCIYCERKFGSEEKSLVEHDLEHYRPKGRVTAWEPPDALKAMGVTVKAPPALGGYHLLAFHLDNYSASCKTCNSIFKKDRFPVAGSYRLASTNPRRTKQEKALLLYPFGDQDIDPETVISFRAYVPYAVPGHGFDTLRAATSIAFFGLDSPQERSDLFRERAFLITQLHEQLAKRVDARFTTAERDDADEQVQLFLSPFMPHTNCVRTYARLFDSDRPTAELYFRESLAFWKSKTPTPVR